MFEPFQKGKRIIQTLQTNGYEAYFVGGAVRDFLLKREIGDIDIATSASPSETMLLFPKTIDVGAAHGTVIVLFEGEQFEVTTFRTEENYVDFRRPKDVAFVKSLREDLKRRDFTMNAIAMNVDGEFIDPYEGRKAIESKVIQSVGNPYERFNEDALRMMRAIRFVAQLSFKLDDKTQEAISNQANLLSKISIERVTVEFEKMLRGENCQEACGILLETSLYQYLPGLIDKEELLTSFVKYNWTILKDRVEYWTLICYLLKIEDCNLFLRKWKLPSKIINSVVKNVSSLKKIDEVGWTKRLLYENDYESISQVERIRKILGFVNDLNYQPLVEYDKLPIKSRTDLAINGQVLTSMYDKKPGKWISELLEKVENAILDHETENNIQMVKEWLRSCNQK
ncbi:CCA tRNA nucleotidyltransferase [Fredinandcohnia quinoae]|uniref:CCA-adding enzyme n=1 Tax=Fredinandcohnia quinoae TaxID=2918902 RepID=A0AAW5DVQ7_9BACI|nr:CCA tRNA nucleotidyltransferase [Fredinandcohnia sp. SECRCQ15]MCH1624721.1 CCA tRNA nucleotidyltransferase [Fredinandcohnia sp. SECRCQ15]